MDRARMLEVAVEAVRQATIVARRVQAEQSALLLTKSDKSPVTVADFGVQAVVSSHLAAELGDVALVGEESAADARADSQILGATVSAVRQVWSDATAKTVLDAIDRGAGEARPEGFWTLDPIDGTKGFLRRQQYCISLAYLEQGRPVIGVLGCPHLPASFERPLDEPDPQGTLYWAVAGEGAFDRDGTPLHARESGDAITFCESVEESHSDQESNRRLVESLGAGAVRSVRLDSQCKYAVVARGQADAYLRLPRSTTYVEKIWDHAAGSLLATEAGCIVSDVSGRPLDFSQGRLLAKNQGVVVAARALHARLIAALP